MDIPKYPPKQWEERSKRYKAKYMDAMKALYGDNHATEGDVQTESTNTDGANGTTDIHEVALESA